MGAEQEYKLQFRLLGPSQTFFLFKPLEGANRNNKECFFDFLLLTWLNLSLAAESQWSVKHAFMQIFLILYFPILINCIEI